MPRTPKPRCVVCLLIVALGGLGLVARASAQRNVAEQYLLWAANQERASQGVPPLRWDPALAAAAAQHALAMAAHRTISHQFADEPELSERGAATGARFTLISENVAEAPSSAIIHNAWMHSAGHRDNLLDPKVDSIGIAVVVRDRQLYAVQDFARITPSRTIREQEAIVARVLETSGLSLVPVGLDARQACSSSTGYEGVDRPGFIMRYTTADIESMPSQLKVRLTSGRYTRAAVGACSGRDQGPFTGYRIAILLYP